MPVIVAGGRQPHTTYADLLAVRTRMDELEAAIRRLRDRLPAELQEQLRDPWPGLVLLFVGIGLLLAANVLGAVVSS